MKIEKFIQTRKEMSWIASLNGVAGFANMLIGNLHHDAFGVTLGVVGVVIAAVFSAIASRLSALIKSAKEQGKEEINEDSGL